MTQSAVARFEAGGTEPTIPVPSRLARTLGAELSDASCSSSRRSTGPARSTRYAPAPGSATSSAADAYPECTSLSSTPPHSPA
jgi:hypothetical protein